jgi:GT2 family glycosyltransferase
MMPPLITFLISTYNRSAVLMRTLSDLRDVGTRAALRTETIVVDNASTDGTADLVAREFPDVRLIRGRTNRGACAKNDGLAVAAGRFIVFLDDDSYPTAESLSRMVAHFAADPSLGAAVFDVTLPDGSRECSAYPNVFIGCGTGFRREALEQVGGLPDDFFMQAEEYELSLRLLNGGWRIRRLDDLHVHHLKTPGARVPTRTTRLDVRNNLTLLARQFPRKWIMPFAIDWMRRYRWIAKSKGWRHELAFWRGLGEGLLRGAKLWRRRPISAAAFEQFAQVDEIRQRLAAAVREHGIRSVLFIDVGKNVLAYWLAAQACGLRVVAIADPRLARHGRRYRGIPVIADDDAARRADFDAAIVANVSPVHAEGRRDQWRKTCSRPVIDLFEDHLATVKMEAA